MSTAEIIPFIILIMFIVIEIYYMVIAKSLILMHQREEFLHEELIEGKGQHQTELLAIRRMDASRHMPKMLCWVLLMVFIYTCNSTLLCAVEIISMFVLMLTRKILLKTKFPLNDMRAHKILVTDTILRIVVHVFVAFWLLFF